MDVKDYTILWGSVQINCNTKPIKLLELSLRMMK